MEFGPVQSLVQILSGPDRSSAPAPETAAAQAQKSFEEASFFAAHFKNFSVRPVPDQPLMLMLLKGKWRRKLRKVGKKEKAGRIYMRKPRDKEEKEEHHEAL
ncbi:hypothetical protein GZ77_19880 [Endozoicomonas montiporae]|uniref:Uncharacterized protein n=2 Tax=Endozoicomonas montiporae TaxID=1027273 RepID=A0A081N2Q6_9GAMM|nr:hypothetical protein [Endozoicomonas montiporae]AMO57994.1 hypothetical protein EZMO1_4066 [Endozoicomonas montiporae CL-33]KEQ12729.1 hypothetical protein GZ77_19880 [Endozoicomonas montiporae]